MNDWNQNEKNDSEDKAVFHTEITESNEQNKNVKSNNDDGGYSILADWIINVVCVLILYFIYSLEIEINSFTAIICLICFVKIALSLFVLFISATSR